MISDLGFEIQGSGGASIGGSAQMDQNRPIKAPRQKTLATEDEHQRQAPRNQDGRPRICVGRNNPDDHALGYERVVDPGVLRGNCGPEFFVASARGVSPPQIRSVDRDFCNLAGLDLV